MNRAPTFSPVLQLAPLAAALVIAVAIYAALIGAWRKTARWLRGWWRSRHPVHAAPRQWHDEKFERVPADPRFHAAFGTPPWQDPEKPAHLSQTMVPLHGVKQVSPGVYEAEFTPEKPGLCTAMLPELDPDPEPEPEPAPCRCGRPAGHLEDACLTGEPGDIDREFSTGTFEAVKVDG